MRLVLGERVVMEDKGEGVLSVILFAVSLNLFVNFLAVSVNLSGGFIDFVGAFFSAANVYRDGSTPCNF